MTEKVVETSKTIALEDVLAWEEDHAFEIINGEIHAMAPVGMLHHIVAMRLLYLLESYNREHQAGHVFPNGLLYLMGKHEGGIKGALVPDVSFVRAEAIPKPGEWDLERPFPNAPTLAVEIISPGERADKVMEKTQLYLSGGTAQVWLVYPTMKTLHQYTSAKQVTLYNADDTLGQLDDLFPGLTIPLANIFTQP